VRKVLLLVVAFLKMMEAKGSDGLDNEVGKAMAAVLSYSYFLQFCLHCYELLCILLFAWIYQ